jgi:hypothetical protein
MSDTKKYTVVRPIGFNGDRLEKGATVNLTDEEAANIGPDVELAHAQTEQIEPPKEAGTSEGASAPSTDGNAEGSFEKEEPKAGDPADAGGSED